MQTANGSNEAQVKVQTQKTNRKTGAGIFILLEIKIYSLGALLYEPRHGFTALGRKHFVSVELLSQSLFCFKVTVILPTVWSLNNKPREHQEVRPRKDGGGPKACFSESTLKTETATRSHTFCKHDKFNKEETEKRDFATKAKSRNVCHLKKRHILKHCPRMSRSHDTIREGAVSSVHALIQQVQQEVLLNCMRNRHFSSETDDFSHHNSSAFSGFQFFQHGFRNTPILPLRGKKNRNIRKHFFVVVGFH